MTTAESIYTAIVGSGKGNSSIIIDETNLLLIDCGVGPRVLENNLNDIQRTIDQITGAVITHAHFDHMNGATLRKLALKGIPIYCNDDVKKIAVAATNEKFQKLVRKHMHSIGVGKEFKIGDYKIRAFNVRHDSDGGCQGYVFKKKSKGKTVKIVYATDLGYPSDRVKKLLGNADVIFIESDHCDTLLDRCREIPEDIKENHIRRYHLSNDQCCQVLREVLLNSDILPRKIHLLHIADKINTAKRAVSMCKRMLRKSRLGHVQVDGS